MNRWSEHITFINVSNLERSHRFYTERIGLVPVHDQGDCRIYRIGRDAYLGLCHRPSDVRAPGSFLITLVTPHVEGEVAQLEAAGVTIELPVQDHPKYAITQAFVLDPDGYRLEIQRFHDPNWNQSPS